MKRNVLILFGGKSCEHDISIVSAYQCLKCFDEYLYKVYCVYIDKEGVWRFVKDTNFDHFMENRKHLKECQLGINENVLYLRSGKKYKAYADIDVVFPVLHGINGEDGCIAGVLAMSNIPYVGSNNASSSIGMDKFLFKKVCDELPVLDYLKFDHEDIDCEEKIIENVNKNIGFPCIIKPCRQGSSIGVNICKNGENLLNLLKKSLNFDEKVIVEPFVDNMREFNIAIFSCGGELVNSAIEEPILTENILTFKDKYLNFSGKEISKKIPANIGAALKNKIINLAKDCYRLCGFSGMVRIDFIYEKSTKKLYINEVNTIPGAMSLYMFEQVDMDKKEVVNKLVCESLREYNEEKNIEINFDSGVLKSGNLRKFNK